jgi:hypothetical protein
VSRSNIFAIFLSVLLLLFISACKKDNDQGPTSVTTNKSDRDNDGIPDDLDNCPDEPGEGGDYHGCPWWRVDICSGKSVFDYGITNGKIIKWDINKQVGFYMGDNVPTAWRDIVNMAWGPWSVVGTKLKFGMYGSGNSYIIKPGVIKKDGMNIIAFGPLGGDTLGRTDFYYNPQTGELTEADVVIASNKSMVLGESQNQKDVLSVLVHEFGHALGLRHVNDKTHTMYPYQMNNSTIHRTLCEGDKAGLRFLYP